MSVADIRTIRSNSMSWAVNTSKVGEDALAILARAQLYEEYLLGGNALTAGSGTAETVQLAQCEASQSGPKGNAQKPRSP
jgi:hypothetical protein